MADAAVLSRTPAVAYGDDTEHYKDYQSGDVVAVQGVDNATVTLPDVRPDGKGVRAIGILDLVTASGANANTFELGNGIHQQDLLVRLKTKGGSGAGVLVAKSGTTIVGPTGSAIASLSLDPAGEWGLLSFKHNRWVLQVHNGVTA